MYVWYMVYGVWYGILIIIKICSMTTLPLVHPQLLELEYIHVIVIVKTKNSALNRPY